MADAVEGYISEIDFLIVELKETLQTVNNFNTEERAAKLSRCAYAIQNIRMAKEALLIETRQLRSDSRKHEIKDMLKPKLALFKDLCEIYNQKLTEMDRYQFNAEPDTYNETAGSAQPQGRQAMIARGDELQKDTEAAAANMMGLMEGAEGIGLATAAQMDEQTLKMKGIAKDLDDVQYNTQRARKTAAAMLRSAATDLCNQILCGGIVLSLIMLIVLVNLAE